MIPTPQDLGPLHQAILDGDVERTRVLLEQGANPNQKALDGEPPLHYAAMFEKSGEAVKMLIEKGADPEATNKHGLTPIMYAARYRNIPALSFLIEKDVALDTKDEYAGMTVFQWADLVGYPEVQEILAHAQEARQQAAEKAAREAEEAAQQKLATLRDTATERQAILKKRRHTIIVRGS